MLESDEDLSDLSDSDLEDILDATDVSSEEEIVDSDPEIPNVQPQPVNDTESDDEPPPPPVNVAKKPPRPVNKAKKARDRYSNLSWTPAEPDNPMGRHNFDREPKVNVIVDSIEPIDIFELIVTDDIVDHIVWYSNLYAQQMMADTVYKPTSRVAKWEEITASEVRLYFAVLIYRGLLYKPKENFYYTKNKLFETLGFRRIMSQNKLILLEKFLHFVDNQALGESYNKAAKIQPILEMLVDRFQLLLELERDISIDESLLLWKGRLGWKQYIPKKRARFGLKAFVLCEGSTGYVWNIILYTGADTLLDENIDFDYHATKVVMSLMENLLNKGHCVYIDNWYTSIEICNVLNSNTTDVVGTLRRDRKGLPGDVVKKKLKQGERIVQYEHSKGLAITHWKDKRDVFMMTTCIPDSETQVQRRGVEVTIPTVIHEYNSMMGGVDRSDQMTTSYPTERKRVKKWYKKHFMHLINISVFNSHIIHQKKEGKLDAFSFRKKLVEQIVENYGVEIESAIERRGGRPSIEGNPFRLSERHFLRAIPASDKKQYPTKRCIVCYKHKQRKESRYICGQCNQPLCVVPCFERYHTLKFY